MKQLFPSDGDVYLDLKAGDGRLIQVVNAGLVFIQIVNVETGRRGRVLRTSFTSDSFKIQEDEE